MAQELDLNAIIQTAVNAALAARSSGPRRRYGGGVRSKPTPEESEARRKANDEECIKVFKAAGYKTVEPRFNVLTYKKWAEKGRQVRKGQKPHRVGPFNLFHEDQTDPMTTADLEKLTAPPAKVEPPKAYTVADMMGVLKEKAPDVAKRVEAATKGETPKPTATVVATNVTPPTTQNWTDWNS